MRDAGSLDPVTFVASESILVSSDSLRQIERSFE